MVVAAALLAGLAVGAALVFWLRARPSEAARAALASALGEAQARTSTLERELAAVEARADEAQKAVGERLRDAVRAASADAYTQANQALVELAGAKLAGTVAPLEASLRRVNDQVQELDRARAQSYGALTRQLGELGERTTTLANALRSPHVRGRWGEIQLQRVVELAGMLPYCDFAEQVTATTDEGRLRPDLVVRLPGGKQVVVDAKVPLAAYLEAMEATDEAGRERHLREHARQVREHLQKLSAKGYWQQFADSPDYVVMFLPDEGFFRAAWEQDRSLVEQGVRSRVHIASPTTLIVLLQAIAFGWQQEKVAEDARAVHELGRDLYERFSVLGGHLAKVGSSLDTAVGAYNQAVGSVERRLLPKARQLGAHVLSDRELKELPPVASRTVPLTAPELTEPAAPALEVLPRGADAA